MVLFEELGDVIIAGITSNKNMDGIPFLKSEGAVKDSVIKLNYIFTVSESMVSRIITRLSSEKQKRNLALHTYDPFMIFISSNIAIYIIGLLILGIPHGLGMPVAIYAIGRSFPASDRNVANSYFTSTMMSTNIIIPLFGGAALEYIGLRLLMLYLIPVVVVLLYLTFRLVKSIPNLSS